MTPHGLDWAVVAVLVLFVLVAVYVAWQRRPTRRRDPRPGPLPPEVTRSFRARAR